MYHTKFEADGSHRKAEGKYGFWLRIILKHVKKKTNKEKDQIENKKEVGEYPLSYDIQGFNGII